MIKKIYAVRDNKINDFITFVVLPNVVEVTRQFTQVANDQNSKIHEYPEDHDLYYLGEIDTESGKIESVTPEYIVNAVACKKSKG
jgi:hypothetical protein